MGKITPFRTEKLLREVQEDIDLLGGSFKIYAIKNMETDRTFYTDYYDAEPPLRNDTDGLQIWSPEEEQEYQEHLAQYYKQLSYIETFTDHDLITLEDLEQRLLKQLAKKTIDKQ